jgi:hypothetical protein
MMMIINYVRLYYYIIIIIIHYINIMKLCYIVLEGESRLVKCKWNEEEYDTYIYIYNINSFFFE